MLMPVELVALDIGGVLATIDKSLIKTLASKNKNFFDTLFDEDFTNLQKGYMDAHGFLLKKSRSLNVAQLALQSAFAKMIVATSQKTLPKIKVDYFFASNINEIHFDGFLAQIEPSVFSLKNSCLSYCNGHLKPATAFFEKMIDHFHIPPKNILFVDDKSVNINAASRAGLATALCFHHQDLENILSRHRLI